MRRRLPAERLRSFPDTRRTTSIAGLWLGHAGRRNDQQVGTLRASSWSVRTQVLRPAEAGSEVRVVGVVCLGIGC